jgi:4-hydroxybenzoate polyprenyltransferase
VRDVAADMLHPVKRRRPVAAGELPGAAAVATGVLLVTAGCGVALFVGLAFAVVAVGYVALMAAYNLGLKQVVILDVLVIAVGFVLRAAGGAVAVDVSISPWLLVCTMLLALLIGFGKRRYEIVALEHAARHRRNLDSYSQGMLDQAVTVTAAGTLIAYAMYTFEGQAAPFDHRLMLTIPIVAYGVFRYLYLLYQQGQGGTPESMLVSDRALLAAVWLWSVLSAGLLYLLR